MNTEVARTNGSEIMENVLIKGDLSKLTPQERADLYLATCKSLDLNPLTRPFEYITLGGKLVLYARRDCTDQLRKRDNVSVVEMTSVDRDGTIIVTCKVANSAGRTDMSTGVVDLGTTKGEMRANLVMKAETKAKRRATLSICGLGFLDELEVEDTPRRANPHINRAEDIVDVPAEGDPNRIPDGDQNIKALPKKDARADFGIFQRELHATKTIAQLEDWGANQRDRLQTYPEDWRDIARGLFVQHKAALLANRADPGPIPAALDRNPPEVPTDPEQFLKYVEAKCATATERDALDMIWEFKVEPHLEKFLPPDQFEAAEIYRQHEARLGAVS